MLRCGFTQIYDQTADKASDILHISLNEKPDIVLMPQIDKPRLVLDDIYQRTRNSKVVDWIHEQAAFKKTEVHHDHM